VGRRAWFLFVGRDTQTGPKVLPDVLLNPGARSAETNMKNYDDVMRSNLFGDLIKKIGSSYETGRRSGGDDLCFPF
jgi:hypothetical protein